VSVAELYSRLFYQQNLRQRHAANQQAPELAVPSSRDSKITVNTEARNLEGAAAAANNAQPEGQESRNSLLH
jgi:hypothetical protein